MSKLTDKQYKMLGRYMSTYDFVDCNQVSVDISYQKSVWILDSCEP